MPPTTKTTSDQETNEEKPGGEEMTVESILPIVREYRELWMEEQDILADIAQYRKQFKKRLEVLKKERGDREQLILQFLDRYDHPGIQDRDLLLIRHEKPLRPPMKHRTQRVEEILNQHHVDRCVHDQVLDVMNNTTPTSTTSTLRLKVTTPPTHGRSGRGGGGGRA